MLKGIGLSAFLTMGEILAHIILVHVLKPRKMFNLIASIFLVSLPFYFVLYLRTPGDSSLLGLLNGLLVHLLLFLNYAQCLYYVTRTVTLRILMEFFRTSGRFLTAQELKDKYNFKNMLRSRLELLLLHRYVQMRDDQCELTWKGKAFASIFIFLRKIYGVSYYLEPMTQRSTGSTSADDGSAASQAKP